MNCLPLEREQWKRNFIWRINIFFLTLRHDLNIPSLNTGYVEKITDLTRRKSKEEEFMGFFYCRSKICDDFTESLVDFMVPRTINAHFALTSL